jgi:predicted ribosome quality control (RQC) complex YloA/Tae2 family protein
VSPPAAPSFCMLLRKHINNGRIVKIEQPGFERVINFEIEHLNEMGDLCKKVLVVELMGKHSNIIFCDDDKHIIDSIKHINAQMSSVREVLPGRDYFIPMTEEKKNPLEADADTFKKLITSKSLPLSKALYSSFTGISPVVSEDIINLSSLDSSVVANTLNDTEIYHLYNIFTNYIDDVKEHNFHPVIYYSNDVPVEFSAIPLSTYSSDNSVNYNSISEVLEKYYAEKDLITRIRKRSTDLRQIVNTALSKSLKKYDLQLKQLEDTQKKEKYKIYGELLTAYGYNVPEGSKELKCLNYYDNAEITIPLDPDLAALDNAKKYFDKYGKLKRTYEALSEIIVATKNETEHLESISTALDIATDENDLKAIKEELIEYGYIKRKYSDKKSKFINKPIHIVISENYEIYIGKNNFQNEEVSFKIATGNDWWFHTKTIPGSHVIVKSKTDVLPDKLYEIAGGLAAYYSKARNQDKVEIDYTQKKHLKRVNGAAPGFVIYHTNYSMLCKPISPDEIDTTDINGNGKD